MGGLRLPQSKWFVSEVSRFRAGFEFRFQGVFRVGWFRVQGWV